MTSWPPKEGLSTVAVPRKDATLTTAANIKIQAPASLVFEILRNADDYGAWNTWIPSVEVHSQPEGSTEGSKELNLGTSFTFNVVMDASKPDKITAMQLRITDLTTPETNSEYLAKEMLEDGTFYTDRSKVFLISWGADGGWVSRGLKTERFHEVIIIDDNECEVRTWENQGGFLARTVKWMYEKTLNEKFQLWLSDLKKYSEAKAQK